MNMNIDLTKYDQSWYSRGRSGIAVLLWWFVQGTLFRFSLHPMYNFRNALLRRFGAAIGKGVRIRPSARFTYPWKVRIDEHSWIGDHVEFYSLDVIVVGKHCVISQHSYLCTGSHKLNDPSFGLIVKPIVIKDGAWIASDVFVCPGVTVHELGVAGARSTVMKDIPAGEIHVGYPAKFLKERKMEEG
ncbi:hypothetical protein PAECIP111893_03349 [Paenibacillus plantiphilus]|uniref:Colanic acid biosynthesis acetyltransferase WcaF n=1 Tax=Paenibacillus plantiphilus TaxID=2905650 RepID=A0ABM9CDZ4_9BACL|nr:putative colanic acid biosynthesis acetyltransferase [Paenibacillus plantiphilus]CAH1211004.1 hypothetical protein PAECIP111893_03349 [Paenibacillus plantiphilus]